VPRRTARRRPCPSLATTPSPLALPLQAYCSRPQVALRHALPAAVALLQDPRPEARAPCGRLLAALAGAMGPAALEEQLAALPGPAAQRARELLAQGLGWPG
jgi:hypothetical protein